MPTDLYNTICNALRKQNINKNILDIIYEYSVNTYTCGCTGTKLFFFCHDCRDYVCRKCWITCHLCLGGGNCKFDCKYCMWCNKLKCDIHHEDMCGHKPARELCDDCCHYTTHVNSCWRCEDNLCPQCEMYHEC